MTSRQKVLNAEAQIIAVLRGATNIFNCPWCGAHHDVSLNAFCCERAATLVEAVVNHVEHGERMEVVEQAMEALEKARHSALVN